LILLWENCRILQRLRLDKLENGEPIEEKIPVEFLDVFIAPADATPGGVLA
jgi:hypothetical protein